MEVLDAILGNYASATGVPLAIIEEGSIGHLRHRLAIIGLKVPAAGYLKLLTAAAEDAGVDAPTLEDVRGWLDWTLTPSNAHAALIEQVIEQRVLRAKISIHYGPSSTVPAREWGLPWMPTRYDPGCFTGLPTRPLA